MISMITFEVSMHAIHVTHTTMKYFDARRTNKLFMFAFKLTRDYNHDYYSGRNVVLTLNNYFEIFSITFKLLHPNNKKFA